MEKVNMRKIMMAICIFLVAIMIGAKSYAYTSNGSGPITKSVTWNGLISTETTKSIHFITDMQKLKMIANREKGVSGSMRNLLYVAWTSKWL